MTYCWYALRSKPFKEFQLFDQVLALGLECFFPRVNVIPVNPRSAKVCPFFPNYMFIKVDLSMTGENLFKWTPYSQGLISYGKNPASIPDHLIEALKHGLPECAGVAIGLDRLLMVLTGAEHINEVLTFPFDRA